MAKIEAHFKSLFHVELAKPRKDLANQSGIHVQVRGDFGEFSAAVLRQRLQVMSEIRAVVRKIENTHSNPSAQELKIFTKM